MAIQVFQDMCRRNNLALWSVVVFSTLLCLSITACPMGYYGERCLSTCPDTCVSIECNNATGECLGGCQDGYHGYLCQSVCSQGYYGANCTFACLDSCPGNKCNHQTGSCLESCPSGRRGLRCDENCRSGTFGPSCNQSCPVNCKANACHPESGYCLNGCNDSFWGSDCSLHGKFRTNPEDKKKEFYKHLSAESRSVLLYLLMNNYERSLQKAQIEIEASIGLRNELKTLIGG